MYYFLYYSHGNVRYNKKYQYFAFQASMPIKRSYYKRILADTLVLVLINEI